MKALITAYVRTPFHFARKGALASVRPDTLAARLMRSLVEQLHLNHTARLFRLVRQDCCLTRSFLSRFEEA